MVDPSKSLSISGTVTLSSANDNKILQDIGAGFNLSDSVEIVFGQFKIPVFSESLQSPSELLLPERSYVARIFGDRREPGIMLDYNPQFLRVRFQFGDKVQAAGRYETFEQATTPDILSRSYTLGLNYFIAANNVKLQLAQTELKNMEGSNGSPKPADGRNGSMTVFNVQMAL